VAAKDCDHTIPSIIAKKLMLHANLMALCSTEPELLLIKVLHCENRDFNLFTRVTLTLT